MNILLTPLLSKEDNLLRRFEEIHDYIYSNDGLSPQQTLEEFVKLLFVKVFDESKNLQQFSITAEEWSQINSGKIVNSFQERLSKLFNDTVGEFNEVFELKDQIKLSETTLGFIVNKLQTVSLLNSSFDAKGLAFQKFLSHHEKDGLGQFFTPEPVVEFCVKMIQPRAEDSIIDPACGSGGFLMSALNFIRKNEQNNVTKALKVGKLAGIDISKSVVRIAKMKLILESQEAANILCMNALDDIDSIKLSFNMKEGFDIVLTNPPFGAKITSRAMLSKFELGHKWTRFARDFYKTNTLASSQSAEILFIERCLQLLKEGGRMAIVLPNGNLENPSLEYLRTYIKQNAKILAIINLPSETFIPYGTGVKTSILFLEKVVDRIGDKNSVFFGRISKLGYQGNKNATPVYKKDKYGRPEKDEEGNLKLDEDYTDIIKYYQKFLRGTDFSHDNAFHIQHSAINGRFDFDYYSPDTRTLFQKLNNASSVKLGEICDLVKEKSRKLKNLNSTIDYVELSDINTHSFEIINSTTYQVHELPSRASYEIKSGDIITAIAGNSVGTKKHATALVTQEYEGSVCTNGFRVLRNFKIDKFYLLYFFKSEYFLKQLYMYRTGAAIPNVSDADFLNTLILIPDEMTMEEISSKMKMAFDLRQESKTQFDSINLELV